jgi:hypothetical protein
LLLAVGVVELRTLVAEAVVAAQVGSAQELLLPLLLVLLIP